jgi:hypothetical protein
MRWSESTRATGCSRTRRSPSSALPAVRTLKLEDPQVLGLVVHVQHRKLGVIQ